MDCVSCGFEGAAKECSVCLTTYCSHECQLADWTHGNHAIECALIGAKRTTAARTKVKRAVSATKTRVNRAASATKTKVKRAASATRKKAVQTGKNARVRLRTRKGAAYEKQRKEVFQGRATSSQAAMRAAKPGSAEYKAANRAYKDADLQVRNSGTRRFRINEQLPFEK